MGYRRSRSRMKIRSALFWLQVCAILPLLVVVIAALVMHVLQERELFRQEALGRVRAAMTAINSELQGSISSLQVLAASENLRKGDLQGFHQELVRALAAQPRWANVGLTRADRRQLL